MVGFTSVSSGANPLGINNFSGSTVNAVGVDPAGEALAVEVGTNTSLATALPNNGASLVLQFNLSTLANPALTFATRRTATGFSSNQVAYSTDGVNYTNFGTPYNPVTTTAFATQTFDFSAIDVLDNSATDYIRITFGGGTNNSGNNRLDNIQINTVPEASPALMGLALCGLIGLCYGGRALWRKKAA